MNGRILLQFGRLVYYGSSKVKRWKSTSAQIQDGKRSPNWMF